MFFKIFHVNCNHAKNITSDVLQFDDLNTDVLFEIFDNMEFTDLISFTEINLKYRELIARHYALKYRIQEKLVHLEYSWIAKFIPKAESIVVSNLILIAKFLRTFAKWITRIKIEDSYDYLIESALVEYCSDTLTNYQLFKIGGEQFRGRSHLKMSPNYI